MSARSGDPVGSSADDPRQHARSGESQNQSARAKGLTNCRTIDTDDAQWWVYELESGPYDRRSGRSLIFESDGVLRRVRDYPADWRELSDAQLMAVSWRC